MVEKLLKEGHQVAVTASNVDSANEVKKHYSKDVSVFVLNLHENDNLNSELTSYLAGCDYLILNAATKVKKLKRFHHIDKGEIRDSLEADVVGNTTLIQLALPHMIKRKFGRIVFISSIAANIGSSRYGLYCLTKNAMEGLIYNLAVDFGRYNVLSNILRPGLMQTSRTERFWGKEGYIENVSKVIPQGKMGQPAEIASALTSLLAEDCYINGQAINVSGGMPLVSRYL
jgi:3-oxoacyl-[acyl-carrier protein] reductase